MTNAPVLEMAGVSKGYGALRPLRIKELTLSAGERVTIGGLDAGTGEVLINLVTGAALPNTGEVRLFGRPTSAIVDGDEWLESLDKFGIVSPRAVLLEGSTLLQNLALPYTLEIEPVPPAAAASVRELAAGCGIDPDRWLTVPASQLPPDMRVRAHLARALALSPSCVLIEHPTADVDAATRQPLAADVARACARDGLTTMILTNDDAFARAVAPRNLRLDGATGALKAIGRGWFTW